MPRFRDLIPAYPYETVMEHTGLSREEIDETLDDVLRNLSPENKQLMKDTEFLGFITIEKNPSGSSTFERQVVLRKDARRLITPEQMNSIDWNFIVPFPGKVLEANTPPGRERVKDTRSWVYSIRELANNPQTMKATFAPVSSFDIVALVIAGAVFMFMFFVLYRMLMKKEEE